MSGRARRLHLWLILAAVPIWGCADDAESDGNRSQAQLVRAEGVVDAAGIHHVFASPASRIVSLVPSATQTLHVIGALSALVGRTDFDREPWSESIPSVGGGLGPDVESIVALDPDLVVRFAGEQDPRTVSRLDALGIPHLAVRPDHIEDIYLMFDLLGYATGRTGAADSVSGVIRSEMADIESTYRSAAPLSVAYVLGGTPPWVSGPGTYIDEVLTLLGGRNVFADLDNLYAAVSPEEFRVRDIDVVVTSSVGDFDPALAPGARVVTVGADLEVPGPYIVEATRRLAASLRGNGVS